MVKITNPLGELKTGKQGEAVYQGRYGQQIRRTRQPKRAIVSDKQIQRRNLYRDALTWRKSLSLSNRRFLEAYCLANWVVDRYKIPLPWHRFALKIYLERVHFVIFKNPIGCSRKDPLFEYYNTGDDSTISMFAAKWKAQTFTPSAPHKITSVKLKLSRYGLPGIVTVSIRATDASGLPTGEDLCSGTIDGDTLTTEDIGAWYEITLGDGYDLYSNTKYAIVVRAPSGSVLNRLHWLLDVSSPTYYKGNYATTDNSGVDWTPNINYDFMFEDWGEGIVLPPVIQLLHVRHPAIKSFTQKRNGLIVRQEDNLSSLDSQYLTKQVGLDVEQGDEIEATTVAGILYKYQV